MKAKFPLYFCLIFIVFLIAYNPCYIFSAGNNVQRNQEITIENVDHKHDGVEEHVAEHEGDHKTGYCTLLFIILSIIIGVATRHFC